MLDYFNALLQIFGRFVTMIFSLPFYDSMTFGYTLVGIAIMTIIVCYFMERLK